MVPNCVRNSSTILTDVDLLDYVVDISIELGINLHSVNPKSTSEALLVMLKINFGSDGLNPHSSGKRDLH